MIEIIKISLIAYMFSAIAREEGSIFHWYYKLIKKLPDWLYRPLGGCYYCFTGQVCLWYAFFRLDTMTEILFFVSAGILMSMIYHKIYTWLNYVDL